MPGSKEKKNLQPLTDDDLIWLARNRLENPVGLGEFEKLWLEKLADRLEELKGKNG